MEKAKEKIKKAEEKKETLEGKETKRREEEVAITTAKESAAGEAKQNVTAGKPIEPKAIEE